MVCPSCSHIFHIKEGIPNMVSIHSATHRDHLLLQADPCPPHIPRSSWLSTRSASRVSRLAETTLEAEGSML